MKVLDRVKIISLPPWDSAEGWEVGMTGTVKWIHDDAEHPENTVLVDMDSQSRIGLGHGASKREWFFMSNRLEVIPNV